jgi:hypothetical protein
MQQQQQQDGRKEGQRQSKLVHAWVLVLPGKREVSWWPTSERTCAMHLI